MSAPTRLAILGATGSIGRQALEVVAAHPDRLKVVALARSARHGDVAAAERELRELARRYGDPRVVLDARDGADALVHVATAADVDLVLVATTGIAGLAPTLAALRAGKAVALANKEVLVVGGHLVRELTGGAGERLRPVDGEHCALWQCLRGIGMHEISRVVLTASGGALRDLPLDDLGSVTPEQALRHPTWRMGRKITVDSATLVNKGYEVIEAHWLYGLPYDQIAILLHPESVVHAMVELVDGAIISQIAEPDMRLFIQYALLWGHTPAPVPRMDLSRPRELRFLGAPDLGRYLCLGIVLDAARSGDPRALVGLSAADEIAVERFLRGDLRFDQIADILRRGVALAREGPPPAELPPDAILRIDQRVREALEVELAPAEART